MIEYENEIAMYPDIINNIEYYMKFYGYNDYKIFKTWKEFLPEIAEKYQKEYDILQNFGKPDITVLYRKNSQEEYKTLIIEVKITTITMNNIAQAKIYGDIFNADNVFLVSPYEIPRKIIQYFPYNDSILSYSFDRKIRLVKFVDKNLQLQSSFPNGGEVL